MRGPAGLSLLTFNYPILNHWEEVMVPEVQELEALVHEIEETLSGEKDYNTSADAVTKITVAAFNFAAHQMGLTGFQASYAALHIYGEVMHITCPFGVFRAEDLLYPQYDLKKRFEEMLVGWEPWAREQARLKLDDPEHQGGYTLEDGSVMSKVAPRVWAHWERLANGRLEVAELD